MCRIQWVRMAPASTYSMPYTLGSLSVWNAQISEILLHLFSKNILLTPAFPKLLLQFPVWQSPASHFLGPNDCTALILKAPQCLLQVCQKERVRCRLWWVGTLWLESVFSSSHFCRWWNPEHWLCSWSFFSFFSAFRRLAWGQRMLVGAFGMVTWMKKRKQHPCGKNKALLTALGGPLGHARPSSLRRHCGFELFHSAGGSPHFSSMPWLLPTPVLGYLWKFTMWNRQHWEDTVSQLYIIIAHEGTFFAVRP